eukprot:gene4807-5055_t
MADPVDTTEHRRYADRMKEEYYHTNLKEGLHTLKAAITRGSYRQMVLLLWTCLELLHQHHATHEQVPQLRQAAQLELALTMWAAGEQQAADDLLQHEASRCDSNAAISVTSGSSSAAFAGHLALLRAVIKHRKWVDQVLGVLQQDPWAVGAVQGERQVLRERYYAGLLVHRAALEDAQDLAEHLQVWQQQQQIALLQQQQRSGRNKRFGEHTAEFGSLLDMPSSWWATFPQALRRRRQQQQQQQDVD